jgi:hypothetical protein
MDSERRRARKNGKKHILKTAAIMQKTPMNKATAKKKSYL